MWGRSRNPERCVFFTWHGLSSCPRMVPGSVHSTPQQCDLSISGRAPHVKQILTHWLRARQPVVRSITLSSGLLGTGLILFLTIGPFLQWSHLISHSVLLLVCTSLVLAVYKMSIPTPPLSWASLSLQATLSHRGRPEEAQSLPCLGGRMSALLAGS